MQRLHGKDIHTPHQGWTSQAHCIQRAAVGEGLTKRLHPKMGSRGPLGPSQHCRLSIDLCWIKDTDNPNSIPIAQELRLAWEVGRSSLYTASMRFPTLCKREEVPKLLRKLARDFDKCEPLRKSSPLRRGYVQPHKPPTG